MKLKKIQLGLLLLVITTAFSACTKAPKQVEYIPKSAASVIVVDMPSVMQKSEAKGAKSAEKLLSYFKSYGFSNETLDLAIHSFFTDSSKTGMDLENTIMAYLLPSQEFKNAYKCMSVMLTDSAEFSAYIRSVMSENYSLLDGVDNCVCYINRNDRFSWVAYNDEIAVFGCSTIHTQGIVECVNTIFSKKAKNLSSNKDFVDFLNVKDDIGLWFSTSEMIDCYLLWYSKLPEFLTLRNIPEDALRDNYIHINVDFDKQIKASLSCTPSRAFKRFWKNNKFTTTSFDNKICSVLPPNTLWLATLAINPERLLSQLKGSGYVKYIEEELAKLDLTIEDFAKSFSGDCVFSLYDITLEKVRTMEFVQKYEYKGSGLLWKHLQHEQKTTFPHCVMALSLNNSDIPNIVLSHITKEICVQVEPSLYDFSHFMGFPAFVACTSEALICTTDIDYAKNILAGMEIESNATGETVSLLVEKAHGKASYHYADFTIKNYPPLAREYLSKMAVLPLLETYSSIVKSAEMTISDSYQGNIIVDFQDTTKNSFYQLNELMEVVLP